MSRPATPQTDGTSPREGSLDEIGAVLCAIRSLTCAHGGLDEEDTRAIYSLSCIGVTEWRLLDDAVDDLTGRRTARAT